MKIEGKLLNFVQMTGEMTHKHEISGTNTESTRGRRGERVVEKGRGSEQAGVDWTKGGDCSPTLRPVMHVEFDVLIWANIEVSFQYTNITSTITYRNAEMSSIREVEVSRVRGLPTVLIP